jgi:hypothetical protein
MLAQRKTKIIREKADKKCVTVLLNGSLFPVWVRSSELQRLAKERSVERGNGRE